MRVLLTLLSVLLLTQCSSDGRKEELAQLKEWMAPNGKSKVLATTSMIGDIVKTIGGNEIDSWVLIRNGLDPHSYQLVKGDDEKLTSAQVIFSNGLGLEHHPSIAHLLEEHPHTVSLGDVSMRENPEWLVHVDETPDPHIWMDMSIWQKTVPLIVDALSQTAPQHAKLFQERGKALEQKIAESHVQIRKMIQEIPENDRYLVSSHDAFNYFGRAYMAKPDEKDNDLWMKRIAAPEGLSPESQLSPTHIQSILDYLKLNNISVIFPETNVSKDSLRKIVQAGTEMGLNVHCSTDPLYSDAIGEPGSDGETYLKMIWHNAQTIQKNLTKSKGL